MKNTFKQENKFETVVKSNNNLLDFKLKELFKYFDLILLFVRREFVAQYKQTILGPLWAIIQPLLTTVVFTIVFGNMAKLSTSGIPPFLFYMSGNICWACFSTCLTQTANTFITNAPILSKVYFPRLVMPISTVMTQFISFGIQFLFFICFFIYYAYQPNSAVCMNKTALLFPIYVIHIALLGLGFGVIISSLTTKYRDLMMLITFGVQLWMYGTPIAYGIELVPKRFLTLYMLNPVTPLIQNFRYSFLNAGTFELKFYIISWITTIIILLIGIMIFNKVEKTFADTV